MIIDVGAEKEKNRLKDMIIASFYGAYFSLKGQKSGLAGEDLQNVLDRIDNPDREMTDLEMFQALRQFSHGIEGDE